MTQTDIDLSQLLQESRQLNTRIRAEGHGNVLMPQLQRGLEQIEELSSQLAAKVAAYGEKPQSKAALFLASHGFDAESLENDLKKVSSIIPGPASQISVAFEADMETFLQGEMDSAIMGTLNRMDALAMKMAEKFIECRRMEAWDQTKGTMNEHLPSLATTTMEKVETPKKAGLKIAAYAKVVRSFNENRLKGTSLGLARAFERELHANESDDPKTGMLLDCWRVLQFILGDKDGENVFETSDLRSAYLADLSSSASLPWKTQLVKGGRRFLEDLYMRFIDRTLSQYPRDALLGGRPSKLERVKVFCDIKLKRVSPGELANIEQTGGIAVWMVLFYTIRCGLLEEALLFFQSNESIIQKSDPSFLSCFKSFVNSPNHQSNLSLQTQIRLEYNRLLSSRQDPYKMVILKIIGRCDLARKSISEVIQTSEDYIWLQYWLLGDVQEGEEESGGSAYTLSDLQTIVTSLGPRHFDPKNSNPWHYFEILCLVGLFEKGIEHLYQTGYMADAVHFAAAMLQTDTLRIGKATDPLFVKLGPNLTLNFGALVISYSKSHEDAIDAINCVLLLTIPSKSEYSRLALDAIRDIVLNCGDLGTLLGDVRPDGSIRPGLLSQYSRILDLRDNCTFIEAITVAAADKCDADGRFKEALQLYNLARRYGRVLEVLSYRLSRSFIIPYSPLECEEMRRTAETILNYYSSQNHITSILSPSSRSTCSILIALLQLRRFYEESKWTLGLDALLSLNSLIPIDGDIASISNAADRVRDLPDSLTLLLPELLLMAMTIIVKRAEELSNFIGIDSGRVQQTDLIKRMARALMTFVGMLRLRIPQEIYAQLTKMEISLN